MKLKKPKRGQTSQETITKNKNVNYEPIYFFGISEDNFCLLIEQLTLTLYTFASHGSGWILLEIQNLLVKVVSFSPIQSRFYKTFPSNLHNCPPPIKIRKVTDENCFLLLYCCIPSINEKIFHRNKSLAMQDKPRHLKSNYQPISIKTYGWVLKTNAIASNWSLQKTQSGPGAWLLKQNKGHATLERIKNLMWFHIGFITVIKARQSSLCFDYRNETFCQLQKK